MTFRFHGARAIGLALVGVWDSMLVACGDAPSNLPNGDLATLSTAIREHKVAEIEVFHIPSSVLTRTAVLPADLEKGYYKKTTLRATAFSQATEDLARGLDRTGLRKEVDMPDLRWGFVFYASDGSRIRSIYFDKFGSRGVIDGSAVAFDGSPLRSLVKTLGGYLD